MGEVARALKEGEWFDAQGEMPALNEGTTHLVLPLGRLTLSDPESNANSPGNFEAENGKVYDLTPREARKLLQAASIGIGGIELVEEMVTQELFRLRVLGDVEYRSSIPSESLKQYCRFRLRDYPELLRLLDNPAPETDDYEVYSNIVAQLGIVFKVEVPVDSMIEMTDFRARPNQGDFFYKKGLTPTELVYHIAIQGIIANRPLGNDSSIGSEGLIYHADQLLPKSEPISDLGVMERWILILNASNTLKNCREPKIECLESPRASTNTALSSTHCLVRVSFYNTEFTFPVRIRDCILASIFEEVSFGMSNVGVVQVNGKVLKLTERETRKLCEAAYEAVGNLVRDKGRKPSPLDNLEQLLRETYPDLDEYSFDNLIGVAGSLSLLSIESLDERAIAHCLQRIPFIESLISSSTILCQYDHKDFMKLLFGVNSYHDRVDFWLENSDFGQVIDDNKLSVKDVIRYVTAARIAKAKSEDLYHYRGILSEDLSPELLEALTLKILPPEISKKIERILQRRKLVSVGAEAHGDV